MARDGVGSQAVHPPRGPAIGAAAAALGAVALAWWGRSAPASAAVWIPAAGYVLGCVVGTVLVQVHRAARNRAATSPWFNPDLTLDRLAAAAVTVGMLAGIWHAFQLATELAK